MELFRREQYLSKTRGFYHDTDLIKVITGVRRCGKSSLMEMIKDELITSGISGGGCEIMRKLLKNEILNL